MKAFSGRALSRVGKLVVACHPERIAGHELVFSPILLVEEDAAAQIPGCVEGTVECRAKAIEIDGPAIAGCDFAIAGAPGIDGFRTPITPD